MLKVYYFEISIVKYNEIIYTYIQMIYNPNDRIVAFDCDDTLVMWEGREWEPGPNRVEFHCPISLTGDNVIIKTDTVYLVPHTKHIQKLKGYKRSGYYIIVWSAGGGAWAKEVVRVLGLEEHVDFVTSKPVYLYDDLPLNEAIGQRKYYQLKKQK